MRIASIMVSLLFITSCFQPQTIRFLDDGSGDLKQVVRNEVARFLIEKGFGHNVVYATKHIDADVILNADGTFSMDSGLEKTIPEVVKMMEQLKIDEAMTDDCVAWWNEHMNDGADVPDAVMRFMINYKSTWMTWLPKSAYQSAQHVIHEKFEISKFKATL